MTEKKKFNEIMVNNIQEGKVDNDDRQYIIGLLRRDAPGQLKTYFTIDWETQEQYRGVKCATCGRHLHNINHKHTVPKNRFCPQCGHRLNWEAYLCGEEARKAQKY